MPDQYVKDETEVTDFFGLLLEITSDAVGGCRSTSQFSGVTQSPCTGVSTLSRGYIAARQSMASQVSWSTNGSAVTIAETILIPNFML